MTEPERIGLRIIELRTEKQISQKELAELADVTPNNLNRIEKGKYFPTLKTLLKISNVFGKRIDFVD